MRAIRQDCQMKANATPRIRNIEMIQSLKLPLTATQAQHGTKYCTHSLRSLLKKRNNYNWKDILFSDRKVEKFSPIFGHKSCRVSKVCVLSRGRCRAAPGQTRVRAGTALGPTLANYSSTGLHCTVLGVHRTRSTLY